MTSKRDIRLHLDAIAACDAKDYATALTHFQKISDPTAPIIFNIGSCYLLLTEIKNAVDTLRECLSRDKYMAVGHFQCGIAECLQGDYSAAIQSFKESLKPLRGNSYIDYKQLNMPCKLHACEISYNHAIVSIIRKDYEEARNQMLLAANGSLTDASRRSFIADGVRAVCANNWEYFGANPIARLLRLPDKAFYKVSKDKAEGLTASKDFMPKAKVVAAASAEHNFTGFVGARNLPQSGDSGAHTRRKVGGFVVGPPPSVPPPRLPPSPKRPPPSASAISDLQKSIESKLSLEKKDTFAQHKKEIKSTVSVTVHYEFKIELPKNSSLEETKQKIKDNIQDLTKNISSKSQITPYSLTVGSQMDVRSEHDWQSAWRSVQDSDSSDISIRLRQIPGSPAPLRPKPSRPAPRPH